jgi:hypothetical protein
MRMGGTRSSVVNKIHIRSANSIVVLQADAIEWTHHAEMPSLTV